MEMVSSLTHAKTGDLVEVLVICVAGRPGRLGRTIGPEDPSAAVGMIEEVVRGSDDWDWLGWNRLRDPAKAGAA